MHESKPYKLIRRFTLDGEPCLLHIPEQPNGYLVLYLGDVGQYVEEDRSFWMEHPERSKLLHSLLNKGYTLFSSNLHGNAWGSPNAVHLLNQVYHYVTRQVTVNPYIHVIAEGMGAITVLNWQAKHKMNIRSMTFLTPCLHLQALYHQERINQLFFKRLQKELASSYDIHESKIEEEIILPSTIPETTTPVLIYHDVANPYYSVHEHSRRFEEQQLDKNCILNLKLAIQPIFPRIIPSIEKFMRQFETSLNEPF